jgi:hypothetical protein
MVDNRLVTIRVAYLVIFFKALPENQKLLRGFLLQVMPEVFWRFGSPFILHKFVQGTNNWDRWRHSRVRDIFHTCLIPEKIKKPVFHLARH